MNENKPKNRHSTTVIMTISVLLMVVIAFFTIRACSNGSEPDPVPNNGTGSIDIIPPDDPSLTDPVNGDGDDITPPILDPIDHESETSPYPGMVRSRITNEWIWEEAAATRPIAVIVPNSRTASQYGLSQASVLYECTVEGSMTRLMGIWENWDDFDKIGNIRSTRDYFVYWAFEWDALFIHYGATIYCDTILGRDTTHNIDCLQYAPASFRDVAKNQVDNAFTNTGRIVNAATTHDYLLSYREGRIAEKHFNFAAPGWANTLEQYINAVDAQVIDMSPTYPVTNCYFVYNEETGLYDRFQHLAGENAGPHIDLMNGEQLSFKNIIVQNTYYEQRDRQGYLVFQCHDTTRDGWYFTGGKGIRISWEKTSDYGATRFLDDKRSEIEMNTGKTMILIIQDGDTFMIDGTRVW
ncbi:MAG: DUF3048 domain-containing protein [Lachnospiraceae bacterium]|jgi:hypothetical protein|nr:DUF3048 domain-containing protein [Lachnospiraceae bacterium]